MIQAMTGRLENLPSAAQPYRALADLYFALAFGLWPIGRCTEVRSATERAAELARAKDYTHSRALAETLRGMAVAMVCPLSEAHRVFEEAATLCVASGNRWWMADGVGDIGRVYLDEGEFETARAYLERARTLIDALHDRAEMAWIESNLGEASYLVGNWADARAEYEGAVHTARHADTIMYLSYALLHLAELGTAEGWDEADRIFAEAVSLAHAMPYPYAEGRALYEYGLMHIQRGELEQARSRLEEARSIFGALGAKNDLERIDGTLTGLAGP